MQKVLFIGLVWPEPQSSAAGSRIRQLIQTFLDSGASVVFACAASKSDYSFPLETLAVRELPIALNDSKVDAQFKAENPDIVIFDRFMVEEQYGWRIREQCPKALTILDTEDLHFLRKARQEAWKTGEAPDYYNDTAKREIASILRTDLSLIISQEEIRFLTDTFKIDASILYYLPFLEETLEEMHLDRWNSYETRKDFMFIGNFIHEPNWRTVQYLKTTIWPILRKELPGVALHIYGAYASEKVYQLHQPKENFFIMDRAEDAQETMAKYRVLLAPIPFGAGIKGKFIDAMQSGTPSITSRVGAEDMTLDDQWNGFITDSTDEFVAYAKHLYSDPQAWNAAQKRGQTIHNRLFSKTQHTRDFLQTITTLQSKISTHRQKNFMGQILNTQAHNSLKYMSLWIEEKNKK
ncbi:glycosyltransferase [Sphingobacterium psychroaquaticum]|uniref:glycosyltransferase n=1 Tax=Sphingobacterium psychroaquaticum TaxID=561061 RepID=UPI00106A23A9|nr:glycosyltransferase [Sphingobacterium psychroaquaticum]QBQ42838.1 glycosyltransferase [Sphingobacterium psychroaquaticum]